MMKPEKQELQRSRVPKGLAFETWDRLAQQGWVEAVGFSPPTRAGPKA
jgi:hypothetical protein